MGIGGGTNGTRADVIEGDSVLVESVENLDADVADGVAAGHIDLFGELVYVYDLVGDLPRANLRLIQVRLFR